MKLVQPTDFEILETLQDGRNVASNIAIQLDKDRAYLNSRMPVLTDYGLLEKIGPAERSGLYELTDRGEAAISYCDAYGDVGCEKFEALIEDATDV